MSAAATTDGIAARGPRLILMWGGMAVDAGPSRHGRYDHATLVIN